MKEYQQKLAELMRAALIACASAQSLLGAQTFWNLFVRVISNPATVMPDDDNLIKHFAGYALDTPIAEIKREIGLELAAECLEKAEDTEFEVDDDDI